MLVDEINALCVGVAQPPPNAAHRHSGTRAMDCRTSFPSQFAACLRIQPRFLPFASYLPRSAWSGTWLLCAPHCCICLSEATWYVQSFNLGFSPLCPNALPTCCVLQIFNLRNPTFLISLQRLCARDSIELRPRRSVIANVIHFVHLTELPVFWLRMLRSRQIVAFPS